MLKTYLNDEVWLVTQPDHARVSGYLAAHWGGANSFARPGEFTAARQAERLRQEVVLAIAEHDNGWWEWEAFPRIDEDGLPVGLASLSQESPEEGLNRWRRGIERFAADHPYVALLISLHAYWLYAFGYEDLASHTEFCHPLFASPAKAARLVADRERTRVFLDEQAERQTELRQRLAADPDWADAVQDGMWQAHFRLLQLLDALSLSLCYGGGSEQLLAGIPRGRWGDNVDLRWQPLGEGRVRVEPYPFALDPLPVWLPVRVLTTDGAAEEPLLPWQRLVQMPVESRYFELIGGG